MSDQDLGEQALGKIAEIAIANQLEQAEQVHVNVDTDPIKAVQGKLNSVAVTGEGMVMKQDLRVESLGLSIDSVAINPLKAILGEIELTQPANAEVNVLLTETDLNQALSSDYLRSKMTTLDIEVDSERLSVDIQQVQLYFKDDNKLTFDVTLLICQSSETKRIVATAKPILKDDGYRIDLEILSAEGQGLSLNFVTALFQEIVKLLDLRNFDFNGMTLRLRDFDVQSGKVLLRGHVDVQQGPLQTP